MLLPTSGSLLLSLPRWFLDLLGLLAGFLATLLRSRFLGMLMIAGLAGLAGGYFWLVLESYPSARVWFIFLREVITPSLVFALVFACTLAVLWTTRKPGSPLGGIGQHPDPTLVRGSPGPDGHPGSRRWIRHPPQSPIGLCRSPRGPIAIAQHRPDRVGHHAGRPLFFLRILSEHYAEHRSVFPAREFFSRMPSLPRHGHCPPWPPYLPVFCPTSTVPAQIHLWEMGRGLWRNSSAWVATRQRGLTPTLTSVRQRVGWPGDLKLISTATTTLGYSLDATRFGHDFIKPLTEAWFHRSRFNQFNAHQLNEQVYHWFDHRSDRPFFLFVQYNDPHDPYEVPSPYDHLYGQISRETKSRLVAAKLNRFDFSDRPAEKPGRRIRQCPDLHGQSDGRVTPIPGAFSPVVQHLRDHHCRPWGSFWRTSHLYAWLGPVS